VNADARVRCRSLVLAACVAVIVSIQVNADDWPQWFGPGRDGISREKGWLAAWPEGGPKQLWKKNVGRGYAAVSVRGERVYTAGDEGPNEVILCLDAATGNVLWRRAVAVRSKGWPGARIAPTLDGDRLYTLTIDGKVLCLDAASGAMVWSIDTRRDLGARGGPHGFSCHPLVYGNRLFVELGARDGSIVAFDKTTGEVLWASGKFPAGQASPVIFRRGGRPRLLVFTAGGLVAMEPASGREIWRFPCKIKHLCNMTRGPRCWRRGTTDRR